MLQEADRRGVYAIGVDADQYFYAEKAVVSSMQKHVDVAIFNILQYLVENEEVKKGVIEFGIKEQGIGLAPIRVVSDLEHYEQLVQEWRTKALSRN